MAHTGFPRQIEDIKIDLNRRKAIEYSLEGQHISIHELKNKLLAMNWQNDTPKIQNYLQKWNIPDFPTPVEFQISEVTHVTENHEARTIVASNGFEAFGTTSENIKLSWWSLYINEDSRRKAEEQYLESVFPNRTEQQRDKQQPFLHEFTTSPSFINEKSRYGTHRFTFPLKELMEEYKTQKCSGKDPVLRIFKTLFYKQEVNYVVLIHSPDDNEKFSHLPEITGSQWVAYEEGKIAWKAQAICETHKAKLFFNKNKIAMTNNVDDKAAQYYVWDHVSLAFHFEGVLHFSKERLRESWTNCEPDSLKKQWN